MEVTITLIGNAPSPGIRKPEKILRKAWEKGRGIKCRFLNSVDTVFSEMMLRSKKA